MRLLGEGWDSTAWLVGGEWVFRFPRREVVVPGFRARARGAARGWRRACRCPCRWPCTVGEATTRSAGRGPARGSLPGRELADAAPADLDRVRHGRDLGRFLRALHDIDPASVTVAGEPLPVDPVRRADMPFRVGRTEEQLAALAALGLWRAPAALAEVLEPRSRARPGGGARARSRRPAPAPPAGRRRRRARRGDRLDRRLPGRSGDRPAALLGLPHAGRPRGVPRRVRAGRRRRLLRARVLASSCGGCWPSTPTTWAWSALRREALAGLDRAPTWRPRLGRRIGRRVESPLAFHRRRERMPCQPRDQPGQHRVHAAGREPRDADDPGARLLLRRPRRPLEHAHDHDPELRLHGDHDRHVVARRLLAVLQRRRRTASTATSTWPSCAA